MSLKINNEFIACQVSVRPDGRLDVRGQVLKAGEYDEMEVVAANTFMRMMNYSGSGLPYPCASVAFENTPNWHNIPRDGQFQTVFSYPNSYYAIDTVTKVPPSIFVILKNKSEKEPIFVRIDLPDTLSLRTLTYREGRDGPDFYFKKAKIIGVRGQEEILRMIGDVKEQYHVA